MKQLEVVRYRSSGTERTLESANRKLVKLQERHPDREYAILCNDRSQYRRYIVAQVQHVPIALPEEGIDYQLLPQPIRQNYQDYSDFLADYRAWEADCKQRKGTPEAPLRAKMNP